MSSVPNLFSYYDGPVVVGITPDRAIFLYHLRVNPKKIPQTTGSLRYFNNELGETRCALGLGCQAFNIDTSTARAYAAVSHRLLLGEEEITSIWRLNDRLQWSFARIADRVEAHFLDPTVEIYDPAADGR